MCIEKGKQQLTEIVGSQLIPACGVHREAIGRKGGGIALSSYPCAVCIVAAVAFVDASGALSSYPRAVCILHGEWMKKMLLALSSYPRAVCIYP